MASFLGELSLTHLNGTGFGQLASMTDINNL